MKVICNEDENRFKIETNQCEFRKCNKEYKDLR